MLEAAGVSGAHGLPAVKHVMEAVATELGHVREGQTVMEAMLTKSSATLTNAPVSEIYCAYACTDPYALSCVCTVCTNMPCFGYTILR